MATRLCSTPAGGRGGSTVQCRVFGDQPSRRDSIVSPAMGSVYGRRFLLKNGEKDAYVDLAARACRRFGETGNYPATEQARRRPILAFERMMISRALAWVRFSFQARR
jgi:hypothetical protein